MTERSGNITSVQDGQMVLGELCPQCGHPFDDHLPSWNPKRKKEVLVCCIEKPEFCKCELDFEGHIAKEKVKGFYDRTF
jgi:hypothetical protein